jgi:hypothetical protein
MGKHLVTLTAEEGEQLEALAGKGAYPSQKLAYPSQKLANAQILLNFVHVPSVLIQQ